MKNWVVRMYYRGKVYYYADKCRGCVQDRRDATRVTAEQANQIAAGACSSDCSASPVQI